MEIAGRITANAVVKTIKDDRQVVEFTIAVNDRYRNAAGVTVESANFFNCAYWIGTKIAPHLTKATLVQVTGRMQVNAWTTQEGEPRATLNFHVNDIRFLSKSASATEVRGEPVADEVAQMETITVSDSTPKGRSRKKTTGTKSDDLPF